MNNGFMVAVKVATNAGKFKLNSIFNTMIIQPEKIVKYD